MFIRKMSTVLRDRGLDGAKRQLRQAIKAKLTTLNPNDLKTQSTYCHSIPSVCTGNVLGQSQRTP